MNARVFLQEKIFSILEAICSLSARQKSLKVPTFIIMGQNWWAVLGFRASILRWFYEKKDTPLGQEQLSQISFAFSQGNNYCHVCWHFRLVPEHHFGSDPMSYDRYAPKIPGSLPNIYVNPRSSYTCTGMRVPISPTCTDHYRKNTNSKRLQ